MGSLVPAQGQGAVEASLADPTGVGLGVGALMLEEVGVEAEALPTLTALIGPLPSVGAVMSDQVGALAEASPAGRALVGPLTRVGSLVGDQG